MSFRRLKELFYVYILFDFVHGFKQMDVFIFFNGVQVKRRLIKFICTLDLYDIFWLRGESGQIRLLEWFCCRVFAHIISISERS